MNTEYLPGHARPIYVLISGTDVWNRCYANWFTSAKERQRYKLWRSDGDAIIWQTVTLEPGAPNAENAAWLLFDLSNGHAETKRYVWVFPDYEHAVQHRREQYKNPNHAALSEPQCWGLIGKPRFTQPFFDASSVFCLKSPQGNLCLDGLVARTRCGAISNNFDLITRFHPGWRSQYWKKPEAFQRAAYKAGWRVVPVRVEEIKAHE